ncbi:hypothetical protein ACQCSX_10845 [Pseudarthrobacter sp. P1]|uniref:hypothetical protein n=1 Tax=Pseudarthrobacter sp. P1 TaxID=3418418 RepID=UPI003CEA99E7
MCAKSLGDAVLGINWYEMLILLAAVGAVVLFLLTRSVRAPATCPGSAATAAKHSLRVGVVAWMLSSLQGAAKAGTLDAPPLPGATPALPPGAVPLASQLDLAAIFFPVLAVLAVHALGQLPWRAPAHGPRRAAPEPRRRGDVVEPALATVVAAVFALSAGFIAWITFLPGFAARANPYAGPPNPGPVSPGRVPGWQLALPLGTALLVLAAGTLLVLWLVARRQQRAGLSAAQNRAVRRIGSNRLLRVSATVASGLGVVAGNYAAIPVPGSSPGSTIYPAAIANVAVLVAMLVWKPPALDSSLADDVHVRPSGGTGPAFPDAGLGPAFPAAGLGAAAKPRDDGPAAAARSSSAAPTLVAAGASGTFAGLALLPAVGPTGPIVLAALALLGALAVQETVLRRDYARHGARPARLARPVRWPLLTVLAAVGVLVAAATVAGPALAGLYGPPQAWQRQGFGALVVLAAVAGYTALVLGRPRLRHATAALDDLLRRRSLFRGARTAAAALLALLGSQLVQLPVTLGGLPSTDRDLVNALGIVAFAAAAAVIAIPVRSIPAEYFPRHPDQLLPHPPGPREGR